MVRDVAVDRSDGGLDGMGRSGGLDRWEEMERLSALGDAGRQKWGNQAVFTHWIHGLGTRIDWILTADCWGMDVWRELEVLWCPWSDHWGVIGQGTFGGSGDGPGHWRLNCALLKDKGLWEQWEVEVSGNIAGWRREGVVAGDRWLKLKAAAQVYWGEVGRAKGRLRRKQMKEVS